MQMDMNLFSSDSDRKDLHQSIDLISGDLNRKLDLESIDESKQLLSLDSDVHNHEDEHEGEEEDDDDFTFMYIGDDKDSPIYADKAFESGQIRPVFPLFDQNLLLSDHYEVEEVDRLPIHPTVDKIFVKSPGRRPSSTAAEHSEHEENDDGAAGPFCVWSKESATTGTAELSKKSNSTGFSKLWRIREKVNRSNSDGRDAFVFLKCSDKTTSSSSSEHSSSSSAKAKPSVAVKVNGGGEKSKAKKPAMSPLEVYLRSKGFNPEDERRKTHRPAGFYTNVHGGLSRNVHPY